MSLLDWPGLRALIRWIKTRDVDHYEIRWRPPNGRGWQRVDDPDEIFDPSNLDEPIPVDHFFSHARTMGYYQGEYRLIPIDHAGKIGSSVWQTWFYDGPSLEHERREDKRKQETRRQMLGELKELRKELDSRQNDS